MQSTRRLWHTLEPIHDVVYFWPGIRDSGTALGLRGYWMTYFAYRAAPLGPVDAGAVVAMFAGFDPVMVGKALPDAWTRASPEACLAARLVVASDALRSVDVDAEACARAVSLLAPVVAGADPTGRPLFAANAALPLPADPVIALWQLTTALREHRGDGHVAALVTAGLTGLEAIHLQVALGKVPNETMRAVRGWSDAEWSAATDRLVERGLLRGDALTDAGRELLAEVEARTDAAAWTGGLAALGDDGIDEVVGSVTPLVDALFDSGMLPDVNPTGIPRR